MRTDLFDGAHFGVQRRQFRAQPEGEEQLTDKLTTAEPSLLFWPWALIMTNDTMSFAP
jgi:hypothetical protein